MEGLLYLSLYLKVKYAELDSLEAVLYKQWVKVVQ